jgi:hypothetical protein
MQQDRYYEFGLFDPDTQDDRGMPRLVKLIGVELDRPVENVVSAPDSNAAVRSSIVRVLSDDERKQFTASSPYADRARCCARCGGALGLRECSSCHRTFRDNGMSFSCDIELPPGLHGHLLR